MQVTVHILASDLMREPDQSVRRDLVLAKLLLAARVSPSQDDAEYRSLADAGEARLQEFIDRHREQARLEGVPAHLPGFLGVIVSLPSKKGDKKVGGSVGAVFPSQPVMV